MNKTYLITLSPTGKFFFGGDMTFTVNNKENDFTSYIIHSSKFPQQTSLLGMLRFLILRNDSKAFDKASQRITNSDEAEKLIGKKSFEASGQKTSYGMIKSLSPCFIQTKTETGWTNLTIIPNDKHYKVDFSQTTQAVLNGICVDIPQTDYDPKEYHETAYELNGCVKPFKISEIFKEDISNGINRDIHTGKTDDNALFKQVSWRLNEGFRFAFYAEVDMDNFTDYTGQIVSIGADNSLFVIGIKEVTSPSTTDKQGRRVVLESPAFLFKEDLENVRFAVTETIPFRCMKTETKDVGPYNKRHQELGYSARISLYATGSTFYFKTESGASAFAAKLKSHADFYQIGYNHYQITD